MCNFSAINMSFLLSWVNLVWYMDLCFLLIKLSHCELRCPHAYVWYNSKWHFVTYYLDSSLYMIFLELFSSGSCDLGIELWTYDMVQQDHWTRFGCSLQSTATCCNCYFVKNLHWKRNILGKVCSSASTFTNSLSCHYANILHVQFFSHITWALYKQ